MQKLLIAMITALLGLSMTTCSGSASVGYQPPSLPVKISINTNGELTVSWENSVQTPFGTFSAKVTSDLSELYQDRNGVLIVNVNGANSVYDLDGPKDIVVSLESGYYRQIELRKQGNNWYFQAEKISNETISSLLSSRANLQIVGCQTKENCKRVF